MYRNIYKSIGVHHKIRLPVFAVPNDSAGA